MHIGLTFHYSHFMFFIPTRCLYLVLLNISLGWFWGAEMKIKKEHVAGSADGTTKPEVELITEDTVKRMENPGKVEVCKSSGKK